MSAPRTVTADRRADLARIHIGAKAIGMDPADKLATSDYRRMLWAVARVRSSAELDVTGRRLVIEHLRKCGWDDRAAPASAKKAAPKRAPRRPTPQAFNKSMCSKVRAQLISLGRLPDSYADGIARQMFGVEFYEWLQPDQLHKLVAALAVEQQRQGVAYTGR